MSNSQCLQSRQEHTVTIDLDTDHHTQSQSPLRTQHSHDVLDLTSMRKQKNCVLVRTEFVFSDDKSHSSVLLCGDWSNWKPIEMKLEQGKLKTFIFQLSFSQQYSANEINFLHNLSSLFMF